MMTSLRGKYSEQSPYIFNEGFNIRDCQKGRTRIVLMSSARNGYR